MSVRVYVPSTLPALAGHVEEGSIPATQERFAASEPTEEAEYDALMSAADVSAEWLAELAAGLRRRVVVVAEVADADAAVPMAEVVAVHVDTQDDAEPDDDLAWFATQEIADLLPGG